MDKSVGDGSKYVGTIFLEARSFEEDMCNLYLRRPLGE